MLNAIIKRNDRKARALILTVSFVIFAAIVLMGRYKLSYDPGFDVHFFARFNAVINSLVSALLLAGLISIKRKAYLMHKRIMMTSIFFSVLFLISYICHHLLSQDTKFGGTGAIRYIYFFILSTHIVLAAFILPFILFTAYRALIAEWPAHKKIARITWPIWFYVSVTGVIVYFLISPYYS